MFLSLDGIDGVGKSTQMRLLVEWLESLGHRVATCRDPGSTPLGESLRDLLLHSGEDHPINARAEMLLYMAARAQLVDEVIRPALDAGSVVVSDRYLLANLAYQAHANGMDRETVQRVGEIAIDGIAPDRVLLLDLDPTVADSRCDSEPDRMESRGNAYRESVRQGFLSEAQKAPDQIAVIDAAGTIEAVHEAIRATVLPLLKVENH